MSHIDRIHLEHPFMGSRRIKDELEAKGLICNRKRIQRLMRLMGIQAIGPKPGTSKKAPGHKVYPYLLKNLDINYSNHVWCTDITYLPMKKGTLYLVAVMDWYSRKILSFRISNTMDSSFCVDALEEAIAKYGIPKIFNTDQGSQFTSEDFTSVLKKHEIQISIDSKGRWMDNVFIERLWRSLKYEEVYLKACETVKECKREISIWFTFYNQRRRHQSLERQTPDQMYFKNLKTAKLKAS